MQMDKKTLISIVLTRICPADGTVGPILEQTDAATTVGGGWMPGSCAVEADGDDGEEKSGG